SGRKKSSAGKLAGKKVALVGKFGYRDMHRSVYVQLVTSAGGLVVDPGRKVPDCLVVGEGRGGKPPSEVARIQKQAPPVQILDTAAFTHVVLPDPETLLQEIRKGRRKDHDRYWENLEWLCGQAGAQIDLSRTDLRKADLFGAHLEAVVLTGSDLRG